MVLKCYHYNNLESVEVSTCKGPYEECAKPYTCPSDEYFCFVAWTSEKPSYPQMAGCMLRQPNNTECSVTECLGKRATKRPINYCCCDSELCNRSFRMPPAVNESFILSTEPKQPTNQEIESVENLKFVWAVAPILLIIGIISIFVLKYKRKSFTNIGREALQALRDKDVTENLDNRELNELRNNQSVSILVPFKQTFAEQQMNSTLNNNPTSNTNNQSDHIIPKICDDVKDLQKNNRINFSSIKILENIGSGRFGTVHRASLNETSIIAVKIIAASERQSWLNEHQIYTCLQNKHPNILHFIYSGEHVESESFWLVVEYAAEGSLYSFLKENTITWKEFLRIALGIAHGLSYLHEADIAHRDFKSKNVLLKHDLTPCITDFGVAAILDTSSGSQLDHRKKYLQVGTPRYMAPEVLECSVIFTKASFTKIDVYALSLVLWELLSRCCLLNKLSQPKNNCNQTQSLLETTTNYQVNQISPNHQVPYHSQQQPQQQYHHQHQQTQQQQPPQMQIQSSSQPEGEANSETVIATTTQYQANPSNTHEPAKEMISPPAYKLPFEDITGPQPDINHMYQIVVERKLRPTIREEWRFYPASEFCRAIEDGWEYDFDARISASCFVERIECLPQTE